MLSRVKKKLSVSGVMLASVGLMAGCGGTSSSTAGNQTATPTFSPGGGTFTTSQTVTVGSATAGAVLYCTTDGTTPTTSSPQCAEPTTVYKTEFLQAIAVAPSLSASSVAAAGYVINLNGAPTPTFSPAGGTYAGAQQVTIGDTLSGANIYYTLDGTTPTANSPLYSGAIAISKSETLSAIAAAAGYANSGVVSAAYTIQAVVPGPTITSLSPSSATAGGAAFTLTVNGANFVSGASVLWNGATSLTTTYVSSTQLTASVPASLIASAGTVNVTVVTVNGVSSASTFTIGGAAPSVTGIVPTSGTTAGGTSVTITGSNFTGATAVDFGATAATSVTVNSATSITAVSPAESAGAVNVTVVAPGGTSAISANDQFTYTVPAPTVAGVAPSGGSTQGGTQVNITGTNFIGVTAVDFGGTAATSYTVASSGSIAAVSPAGSAGTVDVTVTTATGTSATVANDQFTYAVSVPTVSNINPTSGAVGTQVTIMGSNFGSTQGSSTVTFNGTTATSITSWSSTQIVAVVPAGATTGAVEVKVNGAANSNAPIFTVGLPLSGTVASGTGASAIAIVANVQLYAAGTTGYGQAPLKIGNAVQTDTKGNFSVLYDCSSLPAPGDQLYLVATGTSSTNVILMAGLGSCTGISSLTSVTINEVTTIAAAYALSGFGATDTANGGIDIGAPALASDANCNAAGNWQSSGPSTCNYLGLVNAFKTANNIVNVATGAVWAASSAATWHTSSIGMTPAYANSATPAQYLNDSTIPTARINALANMLATCVENTSACTTLFNAAKTSSVTPIDTLQTALNIALNPSNNVQTLLGLVPASNPPYTTTLTLSGAGAPTDLTLALTFTGAGLGLPPDLFTNANGGGNATIGGVSYADEIGPSIESALAIDASGSVWVASYVFDVANFGPDAPLLAGFNNLGAPITPATTYNSTTNTIAFGGFIPDPTATAQSGADGLGLVDIAIDQTGNLWVVGNPARGGDLLEIANTANPSVLNGPITLQYVSNNLAIDNVGDIWVGSEQTIGEYSNTGNLFPFTTKQGEFYTQGQNYLLFDLNDDLWVLANKDGKTGTQYNVDQISTSDGSILFSGFTATGASLFPFLTTLAADGAGNVYGCADSSRHLDQFTAGAWVNSASAPAIATGRACGDQLVIDGQGRLFAVSNNTQQAVDEFTAVGALISPTATGYTGTSSAEPVTLNPNGGNIGFSSGNVVAAMDGSGNLWVINNTTFGNTVNGNALIEYVGIGAPVATPTSVALANGVLGARP
jgi:hypothetical protein